MEESVEDSEWSGGRHWHISSRASLLAQLRSSVALWSGAKLSCCHRSRVFLICLSNSLWASQIQRKDTAEGGVKKKKTPKEEQELYEVLCPACVYEH